MINSARVPGWLLILFVAFFAACSGGGDKQQTTELDKAIEEIKGLEDVKTTIERQVLSDAIKIIRKYADKGDKRAMFWVTEGRSLDPSNKNYVSLTDSVSWLEKSASKGYVDAALALADLYAREEKIKSMDKAYYWYYIGYYAKDGKVHALTKDRSTSEPGDFRNESGVDDVVKQLSYEKLLGIETQAKTWLQTHFKKS